MLRRFFILSVISVLALTGCPPKKNAKEKLRTGRTALSPTGGKNASGGTNSYMSSALPGTVWGQINADQNAAYYFSLPALANAAPEEQLGQVMGVMFWGNVVMYGNQIDPMRSKIHIEIWDNKTGQVRSNGSLIEQLMVHIGPEQEGYTGAYQSQDGIVFTSSYMSIKLQGQDSGGQFSGQILFNNAYTGDQWYPLGQFQVSSSGFFVGQQYYGPGF